MSKTDRNRHLFVVNDFPPIIGGQSVFLYYLCRGLPAGKITVLAPSCGDTREFDKAQSFQIIRRPYLVSVPLIEKPLKIIGSFFWMLTLLRQQKIGLLHCAHVLSTGFLGLFVKTFLGMDYVVYTHSADVLEHQRVFLIRFFLRKILLNAKVVAANSSFTAGIIMALGVPSERVTILYPRIDPQEFSEISGDSDILKRLGLVGKRVILSVNRLVERKGNDLVIDAMPQILKQFPEACYVIFGTGPQKCFLERMIAALGLEGKILLVSGNAQERVALFKACEVFVMVSREIPRKGDAEGFGVVYLEANACGKPVVAGDSGGVKDAVLHGTTGLLVDSVSVEATATAIMRLLDDPALATKLGEHGRQRVQRDFDFRRGIRELEFLFHE